MVVPLWDVLKFLMLDKEKIQKNGKRERFTIHQSPCELSISLIYSFYALRYQVAKEPHKTTGYLIKATIVKLFFTYSGHMSYILVLNR
jgi:hypothetical protein